MIDPQVAGVRDQLFKQLLQLKMPKNKITDLKSGSSGISQKDVVAGSALYLTTSMAQKDVFIK